MKPLMTVYALCFVGSLALVFAAQAQETTATRQTTEVTDDGATRTTKTTTVEGKVLRYEPGKTIVVVGSDNREVSYMIGSSVVVPTDVRIGRVVSLSTEPSDSGPVTVTKITTRSVTPEGNIKTETQTNSMNANGEKTSTKTTQITGTVTAVDPGRSVTLVLPNKTTVEYTVDSTSVVPSDLTVGKTYTVQTTRSTSGGPYLVKKITSSTRQTTTKQTTTVQ
jgi:hypothetical protein